MIAEKNQGIKVVPVQDHDPVRDTPSELATFLRTLFTSEDIVLLRLIETWNEGNKKGSRPVFLTDQAWPFSPHYPALSQLLGTPFLHCIYESCAERELAHRFFGVCPRPRPGNWTTGWWDKAFHIQTVRCLWADLDSCSVKEAKHRVKDANLPTPTIIVWSGNGVHLYWLLAEPYLIPDAFPHPLKKEKAASGKCVDYWTDDDGQKHYKMPELSAAAVHIQNILAGIAKEVGGDHTQDLARLLRLPCTWNRKDQKHGREPVFCTMVECVPERAYDLEEFEQFAVAAPVRVSVNADLPEPEVVPVGVDGDRGGDLDQLIAGCESAEDRSKADWRLCMKAVEDGYAPDQVWAKVKNVGKFAERGWAGYFLPTWKKAEDKLWRSSPWLERRPGVNYAEAMTEFWAKMHPKYSADRENVGVQVVNGVYRPPAQPAVLCRQQPLDNARKFVAAHYSHGVGRTLRFWQDTFYRWSGSRYAEVSESDIRSAVWTFLGTAKARTKDDGITDFNPQPAQVSALLDALRSVVFVPGDISMPAWADGQDRTPVLPCRNGLLDLSSRSLLPHTPDYFSTHCLPHDYDPAADCPNFTKFLGQIFEGDQERIDALFQWFAYNLIGDTRQQKVALLVGQPRSGKGTIAAILTSLLGEQNVANPSLHDLSQRFGLEPLVGKMAAIIGDAHMSRKDDAVAILEKLKGISGEDRQTIDRKGRPAIHAHIAARFTVLANKMPYMPDASNAIVSRLLVIPFEKSFRGQEDPTLRDRLLTELPGVLNRTLAALDRFRGQGRLLQPSAGQRYLDVMSRYSSPVEGFVQDCCVMQPTSIILKPDMRKAWEMWCQDHGLQPTSEQQFGIDLLAAYPKIEDKRHRLDDGRRVWSYTGIDLQPEWRSRIQHYAP